jgi:cytochrome c-type biogenesis protein CcmH/NrfG
MTEEGKTCGPVSCRWGSVFIILAVLILFGGGYLVGQWRSVPPPDAAEFGDQADVGGGKLSSLADLLPGLEAKVKASPNDASQRSLLAQTYAELGQFDKSIEQLRILRKQQPKDMEHQILLAMSLLSRGKPADLAESGRLLDEAARQKPEALVMVRLYQGEIRLKQGDAKGAVKIWKDYLAQMAPTDPRRGVFEERIAQVSTHR